MSIKHLKLKIVVWSVVVLNDVHSRYMWSTVTKFGEGRCSLQSGLFGTKLHLLVFLINCRHLINAQNMEHIRLIYTIILTI